MTDISNHSIQKYYKKQQNHNWLCWFLLFQILSSILVTATQFIGSPIQCMVEGVPQGNLICVN